ncbi:MAG: ABC transporter substrate-binding protein [Tannerellaceae bacterium]|nr:ABC transporter substrate-binding protein [Tannerellaceae bacterium]
MRHISLLFLTLLLFSCGQSGRNLPQGESEGSDSLRYASGFCIERYPDYTLVDVVDPWNREKLLQRYVLVNREKALPAALPQGTIIRTPVRNVVVYTSVHAAIIDQLGETDKIVGVCEPQYMDTPAIQEGLKSGRIADLGESTAPNVEKIMDIGTELIIASPFQNSGYGQAEKIGVPILEAADYMETLPLGRAEWIRFFALLFDKPEVAKTIFSETETNYLALKELVSGVEYKPTVFSERKYGSFWYVSGGDSYTAHFFKDAGADYIFKDLPGGGSIPMSFETVLDEAIHADFWLLKYNLAHEMSYKDLRAEYTPYENFDAFKNRTIFGCNTSIVPYYEEFPLHPDYLLKDLIKIFHPSLLPDYELRYYRPMIEK